MYLDGGQGGLRHLPFIIVVLAKWQRPPLYHSILQTITLHYIPMVMRKAPNNGSDKQWNFVIRVVLLFNLVSSIEINIM